MCLCRVVHHRTELHALTEIVENKLPAVLFVQYDPVRAVLSKRL